MASKKYTFIDLFAGCGGLSEGFYREGFKALAHVEINHFACETLRTRMKHYGYKDIGNHPCASRHRKAKDWCFYGHDGELGGQVREIPALWKDCYWYQIFQGFHGDSRTSF